VVGVVADPADDLLAVEHGGDEHDVGEVNRAALGWVVEEEAVTGPDVVATLLDQGRHGVPQRRDLRGRRGELGDVPTLGVEERTGVVASDLDVRGVGGPL
jgi:hypothetical protein